MDARFRGMFFASAGFLFASIGFTLSVLSTLFRSFFPHTTRGAEVASVIRHRSSKLKHRQRKHASTTSSSISSPASTASTLSSVQSSPSSSVQSSPANVSETNALTPEKRSDFRNTIVHRRRRSESAPPSPCPWDLSHSRVSVDDTELNRAAAKRPCSTFDLPREPSFDAPSSLDDHSIPKSTGLSFLHRKKVRKAPSGSLAAAPPPVPPLPPLKKSKSQLSVPSLAATKQAPPPVPPLPPLKKSKSQLAVPSLLRRSSQNIPDTEVPPLPVAAPPEEDAPEGRCSRDTAVRVQPKRSQTLRTQPYEAPYFFPTPGSVAAENYVPPRRKPVRSKSLAPDVPQRC
ncbi:hypothetical protein DFH06DRAFT_1186556 [Mycena polygramma]|nr:hypothetical protein DFH06DRAFT_1186556 [Mycena polygramma]